MKKKPIKLNSNILYFRREDDEFCYNLKSNLIYMFDNDIKEMNLILARKENDSEFFYCNYYEQVGDKSEKTCGKNCKGYQPRNGKWGICKHYGYTYEPSNLSVKVKIIVEY